MMMTDVTLYLSLLQTLPRISRERERENNNTSSNLFQYKIEPGVQHEEAALASVPASPHILYMLEEILG